MKFKAWLEARGCYVEVTQEDDGSGYVVLSVRVPASGEVFDVTVTET